MRLERLLPFAAELGDRLPDQPLADQRPDAVSYLLAPLADPGVLSLVVYDVDLADELELLQDGASLGYAVLTANDAWGTTPEQVVIPAGLPAVITIDNTYNPPNSYIWGVRIEGLE